MHREHVERYQVLVQRYEAAVAAAEAAGVVVERRALPPAYSWPPLVELAQMCEAAL